MRTHVTLVNPSYPSGSHQHPPFTPLGLGYLAAVLEKNQYEVDVIDCLTLGLTYKEFRNELRTRQPDIVGITSTTERYKPALQIARIVKEVFPKCLTVIGGHHVTAEDQKALQDCAIWVRLIVMEDCVGPSDLSSTGGVSDEEASHLSLRFGPGAIRPWWSRRACRGL